MGMSGGALASTAAANFCGNCAFSTTTYSTVVLLAAPQAVIMSPRALSPSGVKLCQPHTVSLVPLDLAAAPAGAAAAPAAVGAAAAAVVGAGAAAGCAHAATRTPHVAVR